MPSSVRYLCYTVFFVAVALVSAKGAFVKAGHTNVMTKPWVDYIAPCGIPAAAVIWWDRRRSAN